MIVASTACLERYGTPKTIEDLRIIPCISSYKAFGGNPWIFQTSDKRSTQSLEVESKVNVDGGFIAKASAMRGLGFVALPKVFCTEELNRGLLIEQHLDCQLAPLTIYIHHRSITFHTHLIMLLVNFMRQKVYA